MIDTTFRYELNQEQLGRLKRIAADFRRAGGAEVPLTTLIDYALEENFRTYAWQGPEAYFVELRGFIGRPERQG